MSRYVLLEHDHPTLHWDLMLEVGEVLWTWRLEANPWLGKPCQAIRIADHRRLYLEYEGPISGDRGSVKRIDAGEFVWIEETGEQVSIELIGKDRTGVLTLLREQGVECAATPRRAPRGCRWACPSRGSGARALRRSRC